MSSTFHTNCSRCNAPLPINKYEQCEWEVYCSESCQDLADAEMKEKWESQIPRDYGE